jgi:hypothetical protein
MANNVLNNLNRNNNNSYKYLSVNTLVIVVGILVVIIILAYVYNQYNENKKKEDAEEEKNLEYPYCPDYWDIVKDSDGNKKCRNTHKIGSCGRNYDVPFSNKVFTDKRVGDYMKCRWAKQCNTHWTGVSSLC